MSAIALNQDTVVREALALLQESGLEGVTFRKLAKRLNIQGPSLYWYVKDKDYLLGLMTHAILYDRLGKLPSAKTWQEWLIGLGLGLWKMQLELRDSAQLLLHAKWPEEALVELDLRLCGYLAEFGINRAEAIAMHSGVQSLVTGWAAFTKGANASYFENNRLNGGDDLLVDNLHALVAGWEHRLSTRQRS